MSLGQNIRLYREKLGMSQEELAKKLGYKDRSTIAKIESNVNDITQSKIVAIAKALNTTPAALMGWEKPNTSDSTYDDSGTSDRNVIRIAARDGTYQERVLSDQQITALKAFLDLMPDASDDL